MHARAARFFATFEILAAWDSASGRAAAGCVVCPAEDILLVLRVRKVNSYGRGLDVGDGRQRFDEMLVRVSMWMDV